MAISVVCEACGKRFGAPDAFAGKKVKCRGCGNTIAIPGGAEPELGFQDEPRAEQPVEDLFGSTLGGQAVTDADTAAGATLDPSRPADDRHEDPDVPPKERKLRAFYNNPYIRLLDQWLPLASCVVCLLSTYYAISTQTYLKDDGFVRIPFWIALTRLGAIAGLYAALIFPLTFMGMSVAAKSINLPLPNNTKWKLFASYLPSVWLAITIWNAGGGATPALIAGAVLGLIVSTAFMTILFRLELDEIALVAGHTGGGFFLGAVVTGIALFVLNLATVTYVVRSKMPSPPPTSPYWSGFEWEAKVAELRSSAAGPAAKKPAPTAGTTGAKPAPANTGGAPTTNGSPSAVPPPRAKSKDEIRLEQKMLMPIPGADDSTPLLAPDSRKVVDEVGEAFDSAIYPLVPSPNMLVLRKAKGDAYAVEVRDVRTLAPKGRQFEVTPDHAYSTPLFNRFAVSPDGLRIAYISDFPTVAVTIHGTDGSEQKIQTIEEATQKHYALVGFADNRHVVWRYDLDDKSTTIAIADLQRPEQAPVLIDLDFKLDTSGASVAVHPAGKVIAVADNQKNIRFFSLATGKVSREAQPFGEVRGSSTETAPLGLAFSPDGKQIAEFFDVGQRSIIRSFPADGPAVKEPVASWPFQSNPVPPDQQKEYVGNRLAWWPNGKGWVIYGDCVFDENGPRGRIAIPSVTSQRFVDDRTLDVVAYSRDDKKRRLIRVTLDVLGR